WPFIGRHQRTRIYTPRHNGKIERYQRLLTDECLYARVYDSEAERRNAIGIWVHHYNYRRPHTTCGGQPPGPHASEPASTTSWPTRPRCRVGPRRSKVQIRLADICSRNGAT